jgi:hypothetical protein
MKLSEDGWKRLRRAIEDTEYGRVVVFCSPDKRTLDFTVEQTYRIRAGAGGKGLKKNS